ncbi:efflux RND transporter periplasmic adaptor subunit [Acidovorax sp. SUPP2539]|uniref:efflux RND transporter periplasmic adaptor subunit n=1 Tax=Acidovorax sp. SUPP2539 TaxID=2920878 RepID=UPI0023DE1B48|nr:efflux RND transporter periplasmic adaptor subunit [Acidovorax sp. SUPP2539]GKS92730.1 efflux RND transporter periplasmic adaptor subunit [Acidovorax sp. SUPP2539]
MLLLTGCDGQAAPADTVPRAVKLETVGAAASVETRFTAVVRQEQRAQLGFEGGGRIAEVRVDVGDRVRKDQLLARLDPQPARLKWEQADASVQAAVADLDERKSQLRQQQALFEDGSLSAAALITSRTAFEAAQSKVRAAESDRALARRALRQADIRAPFAGTVVARLLQPQSDAAPGQAVLQLDGEGRAQVLTMLPADVGAGLAPGASATAYRSGEGDRSFALRLRSVSAQVEGGATVQAIFDLPEQERLPRSGESLMLALPSAPAGLTIPLTAVVPAAEKDKAAVFVYDALTGHVQRREVVLGPLEGTRFPVLRGLAPGERIVSTGAAFLVNGQAVALFRPETRLGAGVPR